MKTILAAALLLFTFTATADAQSEPPHGMGELEAYSVFVDAYRGGDYELAINFGEWMLEAKPTEIEGFDGFSLERTMNRMIEVYTGAAEEESDPTQSTAYLEEAEAIFGLVFETFDSNEIDEFEWHLRQGRFYHENHESMGATIDDAMASYEALYKLDKQRFADEGDGFFARVLLMHYAGQGEREDALAMIDDVEGFAGAGLQETIDEVRESLFESPEERIEFLETRLADAEGSDREEILEGLVELYEETAQAEKASERALELYELNPDFTNTRKIADIHLSDGNYSEAIGFLKEAEALADSDEDRQQIKLEIAEAYQQEQELSEARKYAREAANLEENAGPAYMRIASIYAATVSQCTGGEALERHDRTVYWLVLDYLDRAAQADPALASNAESRAESYKEAMPSSEDKFFSGWEEGDTFEINGSLDECYAWVDETTTVR
jgi:tetratricopeptide (TPR) repeat protein